MDCNVNCCNNPDWIKSRWNKIFNQAGFCKILIQDLAINGIFVKILQDTAWLKILFHLD
jgi:hypothetical protein